MSITVRQVATSTTGSTSDQLVKAHLQTAWGMTVTTAAGGDENITGADAILFMDSASTNFGGATWVSPPIGFVALEHFGWHANWKMLSAQANSDTDLGAFYLTSHPIVALAGLTPGSTLAWSGVANYRKGRTDQFPASGSAQVVAYESADASIYTLGWAYDNGALLADGTTTTTARKVGLSLGDQPLSVATTAMLDLIAGSLLWAAGQDGEEPPPEPSLPFTVTRPDGTPVLVKRWAGPGVWQ